VFGNYRPLAETGNGGEPAVGLSSQSAIKSTGEEDIGRAYLHRYLAKAYEHPTPQGWQWLTDSQTTAAVHSASRMLDESLGQTADAFLATLKREGFEQFMDACLAAYGHAARGSCPPNEIEYGDIKADSLFQPHRLADLAAFYRAFGLELAGEEGERQDHICLELEFMCVLAARQAYGMRNQLNSDFLAQGYDAQKKFLREHLGRWTPAFARRLAAETPDLVLRKLADFTRSFIETECRRFGIHPGSEDLLLRPVEDSADRMCDACGIAKLPPGALATT
jgi:DMSO reductase family type II enzyme chaperone